MHYRISCLTTDSKAQEATITCPEGTTETDVLRVLAYAAPHNGVNPDSIKVLGIEAERRSKGFLHPLECLTPEGQVSTFTGWYF